MHKTCKASMAGRGVGLETEPRYAWSGQNQGFSFRALTRAPVVDVFTREES